MRFELLHVEMAESKELRVRLEFFILGIITGFILGILVNTLTFGKVEVVSGFVGIIIGAFIGWYGGFKLYRIQRENPVKENLIGLW